MSQELLKSLVWMDYRLAVLFTVILPMILLIWAFVQNIPVMQHLLVIYWRVASLLMITVYLLIGDMPIGFLSSTLARVLIPLSLWFWVDLNEEIEEQPNNTLRLAFLSWRWAVTIYCILGVLASLPFLQCAFSQATYATPFCQVWVEAPLGYKTVFHNESTRGFLGLFGILGLAIYVLYLAYFVLLRLGRQGRSAMQQ